jgi:Xaa-Pro dipeptidase
VKIEETFAPPSAEEMHTRVTRLQSALEDHGFDAYVSVAAPNILWLTNFANFIHERPFILIVPRSGCPKFLIPFLELDHVMHRVVGNVEFVTYAEFPAPEGQRWNDRLRDLLPGVGSIGVEDMLPGAILRVIGDRTRPIDLVDRLREIKSPYELSRIAYGCRLMSQAHADLMRIARPGLSQSEINQTIGKSAYTKMVADNPAINPFATTIMTLIQNPGVSHDPHNFTDLNMTMQAGGPHVTVFNAVLNGYGAEIERSFFLNHVPEAAKAPFETMMEARRISFEMTRPGNILGDVDRQVNTLFHDRGYANARRHRAGHGMGVTAHEGPFLADGDEGIIKPGMVFTIEPGIYLPGLGGFRHSDTVAVTDDGLTCLTEGPDRLDELTL